MFFVDNHVEKLQRIGQNLKQHPLRSNRYSNQDQWKQFALEMLNQVFKGR